MHHFVNPTRSNEGDFTKPSQKNSGAMCGADRGWWAARTPISLSRTSRHHGLWFKAVVQGCGSRLECPPRAGGSKSRLVAPKGLIGLRLEGARGRSVKPCPKGSPAVPDRGSFAKCKTAPGGALEAVDSAAGDHAQLPAAELGWVVVGGFERAKGSSRERVEP